jgi:RNA polymerase sigma-70 factor (ECF subfamily)
VLDQVLDRLRQHYEAAGKKELFDRLQGCLAGEPQQSSYAQVGAALRMNEAAARMAAYRLRRRYAELLRAEIAQTVSRPEEIDEEIRHLIAVVGRRQGGG